MYPESILISGIIIFFVLLIIMIIWRHHFLQQQANKLAQIQKMESIGRLAGGIAHDFNNMLAGIQGAAEVLNIKLGKNNELRKYTQIILNACSGASNLTSQLLVFSRKKAKKFTNININQEVEEAVSLLEHGLDKKIQIKTSLCSKDCYFRGVHDLIQSLILNLVFNAKDAMKGKGEILISTKDIYLNKEQMQKKLIHNKSGEYIELCIKDNGCGIPKNIQPKIFEPFFTTKAIGKGNGMGLAAVYGIVLEHKGTISFETSEQGTAFYIYLPQTHHHRHKEETITQPVYTQAKILAVDDEKILLELLKDILQILKAETITCQSANDAIELYKQNINDIDIVMLDIIMPQLSGIEVYKQIRKLNSKVKIIFMSGYNPEKQINNILKKDKLTGFIHKPYTLAECSEEIRRLFIC